jgi:hypothetical protein
MDKYYLTKFGKKISLDKKYFSNHKKIKKISSDISLEKNSNLKFHFSHFIQDLFEYSIVIDYLNSLGFNKKFKQTLDVGGQQGFISRFLIGEKKAEISDCIEIRDFSKDVGISKILLFYSIFKIWKLFRKIGIKNKLRKKLDLMYEQMCQNYGLPISNDSYFWKFNFSKIPRITNYLIKDVYGHEKKYDLITSFLAINYFDYEKFFKKISESLNKDGLFVFLGDYWWWPVNSSQIVGMFPYASQRLDYSDFENYVKQFHPKEYDAIITNYKIFSGGLEKKPTIDSFIEIAKKNKLHCIGYKRLKPMGDTHSKTPFSPSNLSKKDPSIFSNVLNDIKFFRNDVSEEDLNTAYILAVFKKES